MYVVRYYPVLWLIIIYLATKTAFNRSKAKILEKHYDSLMEVLHSFLQHELKNVTNKISNSIKRGKGWHESKEN